MERKFMKGNEAIAEAAVRAGCRFYAGYPITPQSEVPEYLSRRCPRLGEYCTGGERSRLHQYGIQGGGRGRNAGHDVHLRSGISLMAEGISSLAAARIPSVIVDIMRRAPEPA